MCLCAAAVVLIVAAYSALLLVRNKAASLQHRELVLFIQHAHILVSMIRIEFGFFFHLHNSEQSGWLTLWDPDDDDDDDDAAVEHHDKVGLLIKSSS